MNASRRHCNNEDNYGNRQVGNRGLIRSEQAYYLEKRKFRFIQLKINYNTQVSIYFKLRDNVLSYIFKETEIPQKKSSKKI